MKRVYFTIEEVSLLVSIARDADPDRYVNNAIKALIYKSRTLENGDRVFMGDR